MQQYEDTKVSRAFKVKKCLEKLKVEDGKLLNRKEVIAFARKKFRVAEKTADRHVSEAFSNYLFNKREKKLNDRAIRDSLYNKDESYPLPDYIVLGTDKDETVKDHYIKMLIEKTKNHKNYGKE